MAYPVTRAEQRIPLESPEFKKLTWLAKEGKTAEGWQLLAELGDGYADEAYEVIAEPRSFYGTVVRQHWANVAGMDAFAKHFKAVGIQHFQQYVEFIVSNDGRLPNTQFIEESYRQAVELAGLPPITAIDSLFSVIDRELPNPFPQFTWGGSMMGLGLDIDSSRIIQDSPVFEDVDLGVMEAILHSANALIGGCDKNLNHYHQDNGHWYIRSYTPGHSNWTIYPYDNMDDLMGDLDINADPCHKWLEENGF